MEEDFLIVPSGMVDSYCRLCLSEVNVQALQVASNGLPLTNQSLVHLVKRYLEIDLSDSISTCAICGACRMMLEEFERFRERCLRFDYVLTGKERNGKGIYGQDLPFQCSACSEKFRFKSDFEKHWKSFHDLPHPCDQCEARFSMLSLLKFHRFRYHSEGGGGGAVEDRTLSCSHCPRIFADEKQLKFHVQMLHGSGTATMKYDPPGKKSKPDNFGTQGHRKLFECETCGVQFHFEGSLRRHMSDAHSSELRMPTGANSRINVASDVQDEISQPEGLVIVQEPPMSLISSYLPMSMAVQESTPERVDPDLQCLMSSTNMTVIPLSDQYFVQNHQELKPKIKLEPTIHQKAEQFHQYPGTYPCFIALKRLDPNLVPPIPNFEIPLGKICYAQQQLAEPATNNLIDDEIQQNYPKFKQSDCNKYICRICGKRFRSYYSLGRHKQKVHESNVFPCDECGRQFYTEDCLQRHSYVHTNEYPCPCDECPMKFPAPSRLKKHKDNYHVPGAPPMTLRFCPYCSRAFTNLSVLNTHVTQWHGIASNYRLTDDY